MAQQAYRSEYNIADFGAVGDGATLNTISIQRAVDSCNHRGGGTIVVPAGDFVTGSVRLFSNMEVKLEAGATLQASGLFHERRSPVSNLYRGEDRRLAQQLGGGV
jgi:polygalacturonase